jgi:putative peptidoglycan lipid II flippase
MTAVLGGERRAQPDGGLLRSTASITAGNVASRVTGFVRVLAVGAALGTTFLGNTYQTSNLVSNILFELLAAGLLSSVLVPTFVGLLDRGEEAEAERVAGALLGACLAVLGAVLVAGLVLRPWVMRLLTVAVSDPRVRRQEVALGSFFLWFFLPQLVLYAAGAVATALLTAARRFAAPAFAPVANNLVVTATMGAFWWMRHGGHVGLDLSLGERLLLALGTTAGVVALTAVPLIAAWRAGLRLRPRWDIRNASVRALARPGAWAAAYLGLNQLLIAVTLVLANRVAGGVVAYQIAYTFFLLPYAVLAQPVSTALFPRLSSDALAERWARFSGALGEGIRLLAFLVLPATAVLAVLARPVLRLMQIGALDTAGAHLVARVLAAYALGLIGWSGLQLLTRAFYAAGDTRTPTIVNLGLTSAAIGLMIWWFSMSTGGDRVVVLGLAHSAAMVGGGAVLLALLARHVGEHLAVAWSVARSAACAAVAGLAAHAVAGALPSSTRLDAAVVLVLAGAAALVAYVGLQRALRAPEFHGITT